MTIQSWIKTDWSNWKSYPPLTSKSLPAVNLSWSLAFSLFLSCRLWSFLSFSKFSGQTPPMQIGPVFGGRREHAIWFLQTQRVLLFASISSIIMRLTRSRNPTSTTFWINASPSMERWLTLLMKELQPAFQILGKKLDRLGGWFRKTLSGTLTRQVMVECTTSITIQKLEWLFRSQPTGKLIWSGSKTLIKHFKVILHDLMVTIRAGKLANLGLNEKGLDV